MKAVKAKRELSRASDAGVWRGDRARVYAERWRCR
jgi:hypothetical protein